MPPEAPTTLPRIVTSLAAAVAGVAVLLAAGSPLRGDAGLDPPRRLDPIPVLCEGRAATIVGTDGDDTLTGTPGDDVIAGRNGDDVIVAGPGDDVVCGGDGADRLAGNEGDDLLVGGRGPDLMSGGSGFDRARGGAGADRCWDAEEAACE